SFSSSGDNRDINSQKVISGRSRRKSLKEQDREAPKVRFKAIKMSKENPYVNNVVVEKNRKHHRTVYLYNQVTTENWEDFRSVLDKKLQKEKTTLNKLSGPDNNTNGKGSCRVQLINQAWNVIKSSIIEAANRSIPRKK
ncbi:41351_t:CDS:2, partial [Gigaspora margarita]